MHSLRIRRNYISEFLTICISLFHLQPLSVYCQYDMHIVTVQYPPAIVTHTKKSRVRSRLSVPKKMYYGRSAPETRFISSGQNQNNLVH